MVRIPKMHCWLMPTAAPEKRFGARIVKEREYTDTGGARQTDSGVVQTQQQIPVFTQGLPDYDVLVAADENSVFADYLPYRSWDARPVVGSAGLRPVTWGPSSELWGGGAASGPLHPRGASPHEANSTCRPGPRAG